MLIEINRIYVTTGYEAKVLINTRYVRRIEKLTEDHVHFNSAATILVLDDPSNEKCTSLVYTQDSYSVIKAKVTRASKAQLDD